jgi:hypothetical protein
MKSVTPPTKKKKVRAWITRYGKMIYARVLKNNVYRYLKYRKSLYLCKDLEGRYNIEYMLTFPFL